MAQTDLILAWLNDAHGMEDSLIHVLENHVKDTRDHPQMQARLQQRLDETRRHADMVKACIERLGGSVNPIKAGMAHAGGMLQGMSTGAAEDELVKNILSDYGAEQFEVASYTSLIAGARAIGDQETARVCETILRQDEAMARWLFEQIPTATLEMVQMRMQEHEGDASSATTASGTYTSSSGTSTSSR